LSLDLLFNVDTPAGWSTPDGDLRVGGWCFAARGPAVRAMRLRVGGTVFDAAYGLPRPDVARVLGAAPGADHSGFEISALLPEGEHDAALEAERTDGAIEVLAAPRIQAGLAPLRANLETPQLLVQPAGPVRFSGWCFHPQRRVVSLELAFAGNVHMLLAGGPRPDVAAAYPCQPLASFSGFDATITLGPGHGPLRLEATLDGDLSLEFELARKFIIVRGPPVWQRVYRSSRRLLSFVGFAARAGVRWQRQYRRLPRPGELPALVRRARHLYGSRTAADRADGGAPPGFQLPARLDPYDAWLAVNAWNPRAEAHLRRRLDACVEPLPRLSVVIPVYNPPPGLLEKAVASVQAQVYGGWELCIADDASTDPAVRPALQQLGRADPRVRVALLDENVNISLATNRAAALASGEFLLLLDQDDELAPDALGEIALALAARPDVDMLYTDDDKLGMDGSRFAPQFKPDWSPELLLSYMYMSHALVIRRTLFEAVGGERTGFEGSQDYDLALRASERARHVAHLSLVLYHWRAVAGSTASSGDAKPLSIEAGRRAVQEALDRRGIGATAVQPDWARRGRLGIFAHEFPDDGPRVAILIPTRNQRTLLRRCIDSLAATSYHSYEVVVIDNESDEADALAYLAGLPHRVLRVPNSPGGFSFAHVNNVAARAVDADLLLFLNNDTEVREPRWLSRMVGYAGIAGVGAVGARLLFPDGRIQHAGVVHGLYHGLAGPAFKLAPDWDHGYLSYAVVARNCSAVTAACMLTPRRLFLELGGFDEQRFAVAYNDVDYCYRLVDRGFRCVYCPGAELLHHEGRSRGFADRPEEVAAFRAAYAGRADPWYSPHLSLDDERYALRPRRRAVGRMPPVRTMMFSFNLNLEGAPHSQFELTTRLAALGAIDPVVYSPSDGPLRAAYEGAGVPVEVIDHPLAGVHTGKEFDAAIARLAGAIRASGAQVVYGNTLQTFYAIAAAERAGVPSVWNPRESEPWQGYFAGLGPELAARALECFRFPYRVVFVAEATREVYRALDSRCSFAVIRNGLDLERLDAQAARWPRAQARDALRLARDEVALLSLGTVCERKGQHDLARALARLPQRVWPQTRAFIVGDRASAYSDGLHDLVRKLPAVLRERVHVVEETADTAKFYQAADAFVCTSRIESYPRVILEAMAYRLPIVTTPVFGIREQVQADINGSFYQPGDDGALATALVRLIDDRGLRARFARNARHVLAILTGFDEMVAGYAETFREAALSS
jgi:GT2 family glycosyltransferase/glycosyltransferase involved in cell wall biosynthesis